MNSEDLIVVCEICGQDNPFEMPKEIISAAMNGDLILFLGAGVSTENPHVTPMGTLYDDIFASVERKLGDNPSFPEVMSAFVEENSRKTLIEKIYQRFRHVRSFRNSWYHSTQFFVELATMPYIDTIFTTNWDTHVEDYCGATPFVSGEDVALWDIADRKVLKIHGSISNLGSIVATSEDYEQNFDAMSRGFLGGFLRTTLATKTVVFIGYSLRDWNILQIYRELTDDLGISTPKAYTVSPNAARTHELKHVEPIATSGSNFLRSLKQEMFQGGFFPDSIYDDMQQMLEEVHRLDPRNSENRLDHQTYPMIIYSWAYNDGLRDALDRALRLRNSGEYSSKATVHKKLHTYDVLIENALGEGLYFDAAYLFGYWDGLSLPFRTQEPVEGVEDGIQTTEEGLSFVPIFQYESEHVIGTLEDLKEYLQLEFDVPDDQLDYARNKLKDTPNDFIIRHSGELPSVIFTPNPKV